MAVYIWNLRRAKMRERNTDKGESRLSMPLYNAASAMVNQLLETQLEVLWRRRNNTILCQI